MQIHTSEHSMPAVNDLVVIYSQTTTTHLFVVEGKELGEIIVINMRNATIYGEYKTVHEFNDHLRKLERTIRIYNSKEYAIWFQKRGN